MRQRVWLRVSAMSVVMASAACGGSDGRDGLSPVSAIEDVGPGSDCENGGVRFKFGLDQNGNGVLDEPAELANQSVHCDASPSATLRSEAEAAGANCTDGGFALYQGAELLGYVCNGSTGKTGPAGATGARGAELHAALESEGSHCTKGGIAVSSSSEGVIGYVCNGNPGPAGSDLSVSAEDAVGHCGSASGFAVYGAGELQGYLCNGQDGSDASPFLLDDSAVASGADSDCPYGGHRLRWGRDSGALDGVLQPEEELGGAALCNAAPALCSSDYHAHSQADVDALSVCLHEIAGSLTLDGADITTLSALSGLTKIVGSLTVVETGLGSLQGLDNLTAIGGDLTIESTNPSFASFAGLGALQTIGGTFWVGDLAGPADFSELTSIAHIGALFTHDDGAITSYDGLQGLSELTLNNFARSIVSLTGLDHLTTLGGSDFRFGGSDNLLVSDLSPLSHLTTLGSLIVQQGAAIDDADLSALASVTTLGDVYIEASGPVSDLSALAPTKLTGSFELVGTGAVSGLDTFFASITEIPGDLRITQQTLPSLSFLANVTAIGGTTTLQNNPNITSFAGLESVTSMGAKLASAAGTGLNIYNGPSTLCGLVSLTSFRGIVYDNDGSFSDWQTKLGIPQPACP